MKPLPEAAKAYKRTPEFNQETIPQGLLREHRTKADVWGRIVVLEGELEYVVAGGRSTDQDRRWRLSPACSGIIEPQVVHSVVPVGPVRFYVEFLRAED